MSNIAHEIVDKLHAGILDLEDRVRKIEGPTVDRVEKKAQRLVQKGRYDSIGKAMTALLNASPELRKRFVKDREVAVSKSARDHEAVQREIQRRAEKLVAEGRFETVGQASTHLLENDNELRGRYLGRTEE